MNSNESKVLEVLFKTLDKKLTISYLASELKLSRTGMWKILKKLEKNKMVLLIPIGSGKTGIYETKLNWENLLLEKTLSLILSEESVRNQRWVENFKNLEHKVSFLILYGSILHSQKEANDIDILGVTKDNNFREIDSEINNIQKTQIKKIHFIGLTEKELVSELEKPNKAFEDAIKKGVILFGQEKFIKFIKYLRK